MTCGIYALSFNSTDKVYIGQSVNIELRFKAHLKNFNAATASSKLLAAFYMYGIPNLHILLTCKTEELDNLEIELIKEFDSINNGFNILDGNTPGGQGYMACNSIYTREQILNIFDMLCNGSTREQVSERLNIPVGSVGNILSGSSHLWLKEEFPDKYDQMRKQAKTKCSLKNCAKGRGFNYPPIISPKGVIYKDIENVAEFARNNGLDRAAISRVLRNKYPVHKGWRLYNGS